MASNAFRIKSLVIVLILTLIPVTAFSASKITPGGKCKVVNQKVTYLNKTYTCIKSGKNLIWSKGIPVTKKGSDTTTPSSSPSPTPSPSTTQQAAGPSDSLNFKKPMIYDTRDGQLIRRADSGTYFDTDSRQVSNFDAIRIKAYKELNQNPRNRVHPNIEFNYSISPSFPKFLVEHSKRELDEAAALWDSFIGKKINVNVYLVTEQDRESIKSNPWLQRNLPEVFSRFESKRERPFIAGGGGYWQSNGVWAGNIFLATASYLDPTFINYEWPAIAKHEFVHLVQDYAFARNGRMGGGEGALFSAVQPQNFREGSANTIAYLTAFRNIGWSHDALDWLIWRRAEDSKDWKKVNSLEEVKSLIIATDVGTPNQAFEQSYAVGALMYEWVIGTYGLEGYKKMINEFATITSFSQAVQTAFGIKKEDLYENLSEYVYKSYLRVYSK
jgi:hypothetical protein